MSNRRLFADKALRTENTAAHTAQQYVVTMTTMFAMEARQVLQLWKHMADNRRFALEATKWPPPPLGQTNEEPSNQHVAANTGNFAPYMTVPGAPGRLGSVPEARVVQGPPGYAGHGMQHAHGTHGSGVYVAPGDGAHGGNDQDVCFLMPHPQC